MEFLERNSFDVRAVVYRLTHRDHPLAFELFPMVHLAAPTFYESIATRLKLCDVILFEGVRGTSARLLTKAYEFAGDSSRLGLVLQRDALRLAEMPGTLVHADVSAQDFDREWRQVPFLHRLFISGAAPIVGLFLRFAGTRALIAPALQVDDLSSAEAVSDDASGWDAIDRVIVDSRDRHLVGVVRSFFEEHHSNQITAAVVFGAEHIPVVARALMQGCGYRVARADWAIVFSLVEDRAD